MPKFNDEDLNKWRESDIWTDSLWIIPKRDNSGKHSGFYHGNFVPQIPRQLISRYSKRNDVIFDPFLGSGTTAYEAESLGRNFIGVDIQKDLIAHVRKELSGNKEQFGDLVVGDSASAETFSKVKSILKDRGKEFIQLAILHPPYADIIKFSSLENDLSNASSLNDFLRGFSDVVKNTIEILEKGRYVAIVMGDKYTNGQWIPLGFYCMNEAQKAGLTLKSIVVKNMEGNRAKQSKAGIWRYRALASDYYIFKHEYIFILKK